MPRLPGMTIKNVSSHCKSGISMKRIAEKTGVSKTTVFRILKENDVTDLKAKNGRKQKLSKRLKASIIKNFENNQHNTASDAVKWIKKNFNIEISTQTIRNINKSGGLTSYKKLKNPF